MGRKRKSEAIDDGAHQPRPPPPPPPPPRQRAQASSQSSTPARTQFSSPRPTQTPNHTPLRPHHSTPQLPPVNHVPYLPSARVTPWVKPAEWIAEQDVWDILTIEINQFVREVEPEPCTHHTRNMLIKCLETTIQSVWPEAKLLVYGSHQTLLYIQDGDIDVTMVLEGLEESARGQLLRRVLALLKEKGMIRGEPKDLSFAGKPLITFTTFLGAVSFDLNVNSVDALQTIDVVKALLLEMPVIRPLMLLCKLISIERGLNVPYEGGMGSYVLLLLIAHFIKNHPWMRRQNIDPFRNLGILLYDLLRFYGDCFEPALVGLSFNADRPYFRASDRIGWNLMPRQMPIWIEDPIRPENHVAGSTEFRDICNSFSSAARTLEAAVQKRYDDLEQFRDGTHHRAAQRTQILSESMLGDIVTLSERMVNHRADLRKLHATNILQKWCGHPPAPFVPSLIT